SASVAGDAFVNLKGELAKSQQAILSLEEQLSAKQGKSYWWVYLLLAAGAAYLVMTDWHQEGKISDDQFQVLRELVNPELMTTVDCLLDLLPEN
ncbi:16772_t:CDS:2, partial [Funneliformis geosporum]